MIRRALAPALCTGLLCLLAARPAGPAVAASQDRATLSANVRGFVKVDAAVIALTNARIIDGTGAPAREEQTLVIRDGRIAEIGDAARVDGPGGRHDHRRLGQERDPGLVMVHEHLYYPTGPQVYGQLGQSFIRLYLAGGVTTMRTGGNVNGLMDLNLKRLIDAGQQPGPGDRRHRAVPERRRTRSCRCTGCGMPTRPRRQVDYWADMGATSFKAYMNITRAAARRGDRGAHTRELKVTGHLCSVTYAEAADLGIDNLEHGFLAATDFVADKQPDVCPGQGRGQQTVAALEPDSAPFTALVKKLVDKQRGTDVDADGVRDVHAGPADAARPRRAAAAAARAVRADTRAHGEEPAVGLRPAVSEGDGARARVRPGRRHADRRHRSHRAGGVIPGYSNQRQVELLVEAGFSPARGHSRSAR